MNTNKLFGGILLAAVLASSQASAGACDTGKRTFPANNGADSRNLSCGGAAALVAAQQVGGVKSVGAKLNAGTKRARTNGIDSGGNGMLGCFIEDAAPVDGSGQSDNTGCGSAVKWIGTLFF